MFSKTHRNANSGAYRNRTLWEACWYHAKKYSSDPIWFWTTLLTLGLAFVYVLFVTSPASFPAGVAEVKDGTLHYVNLLTLIGLAFTALGLILAIKEFRSHHERIVGYRDFYKWVRTLFQEIENREADQFFFYGSTLLPGNISYEDERQIDQLKANLEKIFGVSTDTDKQFSDMKRAVLIIPTQDDLRVNYNWFHRVRIKGLTRKHRDELEWKRFVDASFDAAREFQERLQNTQCPNRYVYTPRDVRLNAIKQAYFLSNGVRVIYAMPLHFTDTIEVDGEHERIVPHIVGFTTTAYEIVQAYHKHFDELTGYAQVRLLEDMYSKHLISPVNLRKLIEKPLPANPVDLLAEWDQDHFGNKAATDECISRTGIDRNSHVLDVGSGVGGTARYLAAKTSCHVDGIELLSDRQEYAIELTREMPIEIQERVHFFLGDATQMDLPKEQYTHVVVFLSILHFVEKEQFLRWIGTVLKPGGKIFIEDYCRPDPDTTDIYDTNRRKLRETISCPNLLTQTQVVELLRQGGITVTNVQDMTGVWQTRAEARCQLYSQKSNEWARTIGPDAVARAIEFAKGVNELFAAKAIRGIRLIGEKPA